MVFNANKTVEIYTEEDVFYYENKVGENDLLHYQKQSIPVNFFDLNDEDELQPMFMLFEELDLGDGDKIPEGGILLLEAIKIKYPTGKVIQK